MHCEGCSEPRASKLPDRIDDSSLIGSLPNQPAEIRRMKLPVGARRGADLVMKLLHLGIFFGQWLRLR